MRRRRSRTTRRRTTLTRTDDKNYCGGEVMMVRRSTRTLTRTFIWFPLDNTLFMAPDIQY